MYIVTATIRPTSQEWKDNVDFSKENYPYLEIFCKSFPLLSEAASCIEKLKADYKSILSPSPRRISIELWSDDDLLSGIEITLQDYLFGSTVYGIKFPPNYTPPSKEENIT